VGFHQDVGENWNGIASLDHAMDVAQRLQKFCTLYGNFHGNPAPAPSKRPLKPGATASRLAECEAWEQRWGQRALCATARVGGGGRSQGVHNPPPSKKAPTEPRRGPFLRL